jgi:hypothetical protein
MFDLIGVLRAAEPQKKAELYGELGLNLMYEPNARRVLVGADLSRVRMVRVGGASGTNDQSNPDWRLRPWR